MENNYLLAVLGLAIVAGAYLAYRLFAKKYPEKKRYIGQSCCTLMKIPGIAILITERISGAVLFRFLRKDILSARKWK